MSLIGRKRKLSYLEKSGFALELLPTFEALHPPFSSLHTFISDPPSPPSESFCSLFSFMHYYYHFIFTQPTLPHPTPRVKQSMPCRQTSVTLTSQGHGKHASAHARWVSRHTANSQLKGVQKDVINHCIAIYKQRNDCYE